MESGGGFDAGAETLRVAVDVGGTFTDVFVFEEAGATTRVAKVPSTPHDPMEAVLDGVAAAGIDLHRVSLFSHGTTVATNALITRRFPKVAMVTTAGCARRLATESVLATAAR